MRRLLLGVSMIVVASSAAAQAIDFSTTAALERTCRRYGTADPARLATDADRVAFALCAGISLLKEGARAQGEAQGGMRFDEKAFIDHIRATLESMLARIRNARQALEQVKTPGPYFRIQPGNWELDLNGDGRIDPAEKYFFWVPKRGLNTFPAGPRDAPFYEAHFVRTVLRVDLADVYWTIAYCHFAEAALNLVLAYDYVVGSDLRVELRDAKRVSTVAYANLLGGVSYSKRLREALAKETDDAEEWISSPKQKNTSFPITMDAQTFATWGRLLGHLEKLFRGQTLLGGGAPNARDFPAVRDLTMGLCQKGEGISVRSLFADPIRRPLDEALWRARCVEPTEKTPLSGLAALVAESIQRNGGRSDFSGEWMILRHLYWVN